ncbi:MAG TPA: YbhB/YbcL family Raf kinase inhibitor-like protein [Acidobacteria bacterium]|nr:YbhB/YbcL family Raf kinase inhibitor-like protein [Acidobacteriota bacterium]
MRALHGLLCLGLGLSLSADPTSAQPAPRSILVESPVLTSGDAMPRVYTPDGQNLSPPLTWSNLPDGTREIAVLCSDFGAGNPPPWVHWIIYNIPSSATGLPEGIPFDPSEPVPEAIAGATQGNNSWGLPMYRGPAPPGTSVHHYHFAVFALDSELDLPPGLTRNELLDAIEGHVIGLGSMVPLYSRQPSSGGEPFTPTR